MIIMAAAELLFHIFQGASLVFYLKDDKTSRRERSWIIIIYFIYVILSIILPVGMKVIHFGMVVLIVFLIRNIMKRGEENAALYGFMFSSTAFMALILAQYMVMAASGQNFWDLQDSIAGYSCTMILTGLMELGFAVIFRKILGAFSEKRDSVDNTLVLIFMFLLLAYLLMLEGEILEPRTTEISIMEILCRMLLPLSTLFLLFTKRSHVKENDVDCQTEIQEQYLTNMQRLYQNYILNFTSSAAGVGISGLGRETGNAMFDLILMEQRQKIQDMGIQIKVIGDFCCLNRIDSLDVVRLIDSMIEYMVEGCRKSKSADKTIAVECKAESSYSILCEGPCAGGYWSRQNMTAQQIISLNIMQKAVHKYGGAVKTQSDNKKTMLFIRIG